MSRKHKNPDEYELIYRTTIRTRSGKVLHAHAYGMKAFPIWVKRSKKRS